jgi:hypothetical protein
MVAVEGSVSRNDAILPATRWVSRAVVAVLIPAFVILWWLPTDTADDWAWTIRPRMTPIFMGSATPPEHSSSPGSPAAAAGTTSPPASSQPRSSPS